MNSESADNSSAEIRSPPPPLIYTAFSVIGLTFDVLQQGLSLDWSFPPAVGWTFMALALLLMVFCIVHLNQLQTPIWLNRPTKAMVSGYRSLFHQVTSMWGGIWTPLLPVQPGERYVMWKFAEVYTVYQY